MKSDPGFQPVYPAWSAYLDRAKASGPAPLRLAVEREDGLVSVFDAVAPERDADPEATYRLVERVVKFLLWSRGGWRIHVQGPAAIGRRLQADYAPDGPRAFDVRTMAGVYERPFEVVRHSPATFPEARESIHFPGGYLDGFRIGFDLGASDYKVAAVVDGQPVWSEEIPWAPAEHADPEYHYEMIQAGLKKAAAHLPRVDAVGGSSAGILIRRQVRIASLFRSVPAADFETRVKGMFDRLAREWGVPFEVINDGEVTALAGRLSLGETGVLGVAMGSSEAAGFLDGEGHIPGWLDELAFAPVDLAPGAAADEWSGDRGVGANYFSQQAVARLAAAAGLSFPEGMRLPERLREVQALAAKGNMPAARVFEQIGAYLGHTVPWYEVFYGFKNLLVLGRVMSGPGGQIIMDTAADVLRTRYPETAGRIRLHLLDEKSRRVGQAVAAASLPEIKGART
ncbi:MAG TPA: ROK family protein [Candidatus Aminicenantes bacterium]|nr:ROK family protein [Candidatus Aminicenantes bacterium]HRY65597.1 ROK family protein [Candidatus Aminicenantes bacterium]HRZ72515.1 ROK family protein [Candidatus Aminicenantes bacterium]